MTPLLVDVAIIVMGPSGSGKSTIGRRLAEATGRRFVEGDDFHPASNVAKMAAGMPLEDDDRWPWLAQIACEIEQPEKVTDCVVACSALRRIYREFLTTRIERPVLFVYLSLSRDVLLSRMLARTSHYMPAGLLDSQLAALEPPTPDEPAIVIDGDMQDEVLLARILDLMTEDVARRLIGPTSTPSKSTRGT